MEVGCKLLEKSWGEGAEAHCYEPMCVGMIEALSHKLYFFLNPFSHYRSGNLLSESLLFLFPI